MKRLFVNFMTCAAMATALTLAACSSDSDGEVMETVMVETEKAQVALS